MEQREQIARLLAAEIEGWKGDEWETHVPNADQDDGTGWHMDSERRTKREWLRIADQILAMKVMPDMAAAQ